MSKGTVKLGEIAEFVRGINFKPSDVVPLETDGAVACMRTKNVQSELDQLDVWAVSERFVSRKDQYLRTGDILVSSANSWNLVGKCCWIPRLPWQSTFGGFVSVLRGQREKIDSRFLYHWFSSPRTQTIVRSFGQQTTNISNLNVSRCLDLSLRLPALDEQRRIAEVLDRAEALRAKRRAALAQLDTLTQSIFLDMFGDPLSNPNDWKQTPLAEVVIGKYGVKAGPFGSTLKKEEYSADGYRVYGQEQVIAGRFDIGNYYINEKKYRQLQSCAVHAGDILVSLVGSFGKVLVVPEGIEPGIINPRLLKIVPNPNLLTSHFLAALLSLPCIEPEFGRLAHGGTMGILNAELLKILPVILPPLALQRAFELRINAVVALQGKHRTSCSNFDNLFASLQHRAFRGEL